MPAVRSAAGVSVHDLTKRYGSVEAVRGVSFEVQPGEIFGLLGPNGAGKTTTLECLLGLRRPDSGAMAIGGIDALARPGEVRQFVGAQLQAAALQDKITPRQALALFASFYPEPAEAGQLLERFQLSTKSDAPFDSLSGGQKQRLLLALAFINRPRLVVLDEPTAGLDPQSRRELHRVIGERRAEGCTVLLSTHQLDEAEHVCDRIGILHDGRMIAVARPADLIARARATSQLAFQTARPLEPAQLAGVDGVTTIQPQNGGWLLGSSDVGRTVTALVLQLGREGNALVDLQIRRPTLEDVFIELTGQRWSTPDSEKTPAVVAEETSDA